MAMILDQQVTPEQLGAFLMLMRVKEESPAELGGFVSAVQQRMSVSEKLRADLDWSVYSGKKRQLPWHFLTALVLAGQGVRVCLHGARGHTPGRIYVEDLLGHFGLKAAKNWLDAELDLQEVGLCYLPLGLINAELARIINLRPVLGLRSPVHTLSRLVNPLSAPFRIDGVFHPAYGPIHQQTAQLLGQNNSVTIKGDGGEAEIRPDAECTLQWLREGEYDDEIWPRVLQRRQVRAERLDPRELLQVWRGQLEHPYGEAAVVETLAVCLRLLGQQSTNQRAREEALILWQRRDKRCY
jgi:anthranilate phosphoribosyltransferase